MHIKKYLGFILFGLLACSSASPADTLLSGADDNITEETVDGISGNIPIGSILETTTDVNFRKGPGTNYSVIRVFPKGTQVKSINVTVPSNKFYNVSNNGDEGWVHGSYLNLVSSDIPDTGTTDGARGEALARAKSGVGYSYWWGHGVWGNGNKGSCSGSCPNCTHSGSSGADCSGFAAKVWQVPDSNDDITVDSHPYSTSSFNGSSSYWSNVNRSSLKGGDALVYNNGSSGHIVIYEKGDGWGSMWTYECKGCSYGCVHNLRSLSSTYKGIQRTGY